MRRRSFICAFASCLPLRVLGQSSPTGPHHRLSLDTLHDALAARFPIRLGFPGVLQMQMGAPRLFLLPARNKLGAMLQAQVSGAELRQVQAGDIDVAFALRYERADRTVRAHDLEVLSLRWPGMPIETVRALQGMLPRLVRDTVREVVLHRFAPRELELAETMGFEPEGITVTDEGLLITFGPLRRP